MEEINYNILFYYILYCFTLVLLLGIDPKVRDTLSAYSVTSLDPSTKHVFDCLMNYLRLDIINNGFYYYPDITRSFSSTRQFPFNHSEANY